MDVEKYKKAVYEDCRESFDILKNELLECNKKFNLTSITDEEGVFLKHFLDSAVGESWFYKNATVAEVGSGGGFPSLPLKILRPDLRFSLIESTAKKCGYLQSVVDKLGLKGMCVVNERAEDAAKKVIHRERYDISTARAVARLNTLCEYCMPFVKLNGRFIAYKGDCEEEIKEAKKAISLLGGEIEQVERYEIGGEKRTLVIIRKINPTPLKYPRGLGKERKSPIV